MTVLLDDRASVFTLSLDTYHRMIEQGLFDEDDHVELLEGVLVEMSPQGPPHGNVVQVLTRILARALGERADVRVQSPVTITATGSEPEPDLALVDPVVDFTAHPSRPYLVIEVAVTSQRLDRGRKARIYAQAGIGELWIVDVPAGTIDVCRDPGPGGYAQIVTHTRGSQVAPLAFADVVIDVAAVLPPPPEAA